VWAVEEEVIEEAARVRRGPVPLRRGSEGGEEVHSEQRVEEARRLGTREANQGQARGQHARVRQRARVEGQPRGEEAEVSGKAARERRHAWARRGLGVGEAEAEARRSKPNLTKKFGSGLS
jgi:hypothetical protein